MEYKISYGTFYNPFDGTTFTQRINAYMTMEELNELNKALNNFKAELTNMKMYLHDFKKGYNYTTLTQASFFAIYFRFLSNDKRFKQDRNTFIDIRIKLD